MINMFLHFMHRILNPVVYLRTVEDIDRFIDSDREYDESGH